MYTLSDEDAVCRALRIYNSDPEMECISHGTARTIASWFADGRSESFVTTGALYDSPDGIMYDLLSDVDQYTVDQMVIEVAALHRYLNVRERDGETGPIEGWSALWVDKIEA